MAKTRVFISHISQETELAQVLKKRLAADFLGLLDIFVSSDGKTIQAGALWLAELSGALAEAKVEIVLCSKESVGRPWVNFEAGAGWVRGIRVIPVCHSGMKPNNLPMPLNMLQAVEAGRPDDLQELYEAIAGVLDMQAPAADFKAMAQEIRDLEKGYEQLAQSIERIENPYILCAASEHYATNTNFDLDIAVLEGLFPGQVLVEKRLTSKRLRDLLAAKDSTRSFSIIHLVVAVDPENGDLLFGPTDSAHKPGSGKVDKMSAEGFAALLVESKTRLVVLATCFALYLAVEVARITNMIATKVEVSGEQIAEWSECFYDLLVKGHPLYKAYELTESNCSLPMKLVRHGDVMFSFEAAG